MVPCAPEIDARVLINKVCVGITSQYQAMSDITDNQPIVLCNIDQI